LYKTTDGGETWKKVLEISENTGVNNVVMDPSNPDIMYATSEQRRRTSFTKIGGGPESAVYKSTDGGETWRKIMKGLPSVDIGGMGIDVSPVDPNVVYLIVEAADDKGGFFRSTDKGESWEKMSDHHSSGQYYNEIVCDPEDVDKVYSTETVSAVTTDGGKTWGRISTDGRHVDDHSIWIHPDDTEHYMIGGDGGIYETWDGGATFDFKENLPVTQFYRVHVDNAEPFYNVYGGTQDNNSANLAAFFQSCIFERLATVQRFVNTIAVTQCTLVVVFACSYPNYIWIIGIEFNHTDGIRAVFIEYRVPGRSVVGGFPDMAAGNTHIVFFWVFRIHGKIGNPSAGPCRTNTSEF